MCPLAYGSALVTRMRRPDDEPAGEPAEEREDVLGVGEVVMASVADGETRFFARGSGKHQARERTEREAE